MKRLLSAIIVLTLMLGMMIPMSSNAASSSEPTEEWATENGWTKNGVYYYKIIDNVKYKLFNTINKYDDLQGGNFMWQVYVAESPEASGVIRVKSVIDGFPVTAIGKNAFSLNKKITECIIPEGVSVVGDGAFQYADHLTMIKLPESLKLIDAGAFYGCFELKTMMIPANVEYIARNAFYKNHITGDGVDTLIFEGNAPKLLYTSAATGYSLEGVENSEIHIYEGSSGWEQEIWTVLNLKKLSNVLEPPVEEPTVPAIYKDIDGSEWYAEYVKDVTLHELMIGTNGYFNPDKNITRAQCILTLYRMAGSPEVTDHRACDEFFDVPVDKYYTDAICWAYNEGIACGNSYTKNMSPESALSRQQMATLFFRYAQHKNMDTLKKEDYSYMKNADKVSSYAKKPIEWCAAAKILEGKVLEDGVDLAPLEYATRAQFAKVLSTFRMMTE